MLRFGFWPPSVGIVKGSSGAGEADPGIAWGVTCENCARYCCAVGAVEGVVDVGAGVDGGAYGGTYGVGVYCDVDVGVDVGVVGAGVGPGALGKPVIGLMSGRFDVVVVPDGVSDAEGAAVSGTNAGMFTGAFPTRCPRSDIACSRTRHWL